MGELLIVDLEWGSAELGLGRGHLHHQLLSLHVVVPEVGRHYGKSGDRGEDVPTGQ